MYRNMDIRMMQTLWGMKKDDMIKRYRYSGGGPQTAKIIGKYRVEEDKDHIYIWSNERPCLHILLDEEGKTAVLSELLYSPTCTVNGNMKRGDDIKAMIEFAFEIAKKKGMKSIELSDKSTVICEETGEEIDLGPFLFVKKGRTWYESLGFIPAYPPMYVNAYLEARQRRKELPNISFLEQQSCEYLTNKRVYDIMISDLKFGGFRNIVWRKNL